jgi:hypothetical protein
MADHNETAVTSWKPQTSSRLSSLADRLMTIKELSSSTPLLSESDCHELITAADRNDPAPDPDESVKLARMLVGSYPKGDANDPEIYFGRLCELFAEFPASIGREVAREVPLTVKFLPRLQEVREALDERVIRRRAIKYRAEWMQRERKRRDDEAARDAKISAQTAAHRAEVASRLLKRAVEAMDITPPMEAAQ